MYQNEKDSKFPIFSETEQVFESIIIISQIAEIFPNNLSYPIQKIDLNVLVYCWCRLIHTWAKMIRKNKLKSNRFHVPHAAETTFRFILSTFSFLILRRAISFEHTFVHDEFNHEHLTSKNNNNSCSPDSTHAFQVDSFTWNQCVF